MGRGDGDYAVFVGRLSTDKGVCTLVDAWKRRACKVPLLIVGDGPLRAQVESTKELGIRCM